MKVLILAMLVPVCGFYFYVLVNFQKELRRSKRNEVPGAKTIPLFRSKAEPELSTAAATSGSQRRAELFVAKPSEEIHPLESIYLGPFLLIPVKNRKASGSQRYVIPITSENT
jgi:hypothetical protein